jgi:hypothetical protein
MLDMLSACLVIALPAYFNDGSGSLGVGGTVGLRKGTHPTIRLVEEEIRVKLPERTVRVTFRFKNEGPATKVVMAFPENGYLGGGATPNDLKKRNRSNFGYFRTAVDGKPFRPKLLKGAPQSEDGLGYDHWWVKEVPFAQGQTRTVVNEYQGGWSWGPPWMHQAGFEYVLRTGASWKGGKIGHTRVVVDARDIRNNGPVDLRPAGLWKGANGIYTWERRNFKPEDDISVIWTNGGFMDITLNGRPLTELWGEGNFMEHKPPVRRGRDVFVSPMLAATLLKSTRFASSGPRVNLIQAVKAAGGKAEWAGERLVITMPR